MYRSSVADKRQLDEELESYKRSRLEDTAWSHDILHSSIDCRVTATAAAVNEGRGSIHPSRSRRASHSRRSRSRGRSRSRSRSCT